MNVHGQPVVSICCLAYNHEDFIREALDGFLMQETDFAFEILIHDDASTDNTPSIIKEYYEKFPTIIKPIFQSENQYSKKVNINASIQFVRAKGVYIAICEGDDYWTDPLKLQKQVDFLNKNRDVSLCFHNSEVIFGSKAVDDRGLKIIEENKIFEPAEILKQWVVPTASVMFRRELLDAEYKKRAANKKFMYGDIILFLSMAEKGKLYGLTDYMSVYRRHIGGVTNVDLNIKYFERRIIHLEEIIDVFGIKYKESLSDLISFSYVNLFILNLKRGTISSKTLKKIMLGNKWYLFKALKTRLLVTVI